MFSVDAAYFSRPEFWIESGVSLVLVTLLIFLAWRLFRSLLVRGFYFVSFVLLFVALVFQMYIFSILLAIAIIAFTVATIIVNAGEIRPYLVSHLKGGRVGLKWPQKEQVRKIFDREELYKKIYSAVELLSKTRTGALITFEKKTPLNDVIGNGILLNAPVGVELLLTIFYEGTRLHDGAVVIRDDQILAAGVFYTASTRPLNGKYGSRHRAALGISEISDSVTVIVSEETGRISLAVAGELEQVTIDTFKDRFIALMEGEYKDVD